MKNIRKLLNAAAVLALIASQAVGSLAHAAPDSVNVNSADAELIAEVLDGVGLIRAEAIVEYRETNGRFNDPYDLSNVKGIGDRTIELNEGRIRVTD